jgi:hypothetical protein
MRRDAVPVAVDGEVTLPRGCQALMGVVLGAFGVLMIFGAVFGIVALLGHDPDLHGTLAWSMVAALGLLGPWCALTGWRLISGKSRPDRGLFSPLALIVIGLACVARAWLSYLHYGLARRNWFVLSGVAFSVFSLAIWRLRSAAKSKAA